MKLYRYMSFEEFFKLTSGCELINRNRFQKARTNSIGFCFLAAENREEACANISFLTGIVTNDVLVEFETTPLTELSEGEGVYADWFSDETKTITEYSAKYYNRDTLVPIAYCSVNPFDCNNAQWYNCNLI